MDAQTAAVSITGLSVRRGKTPVLHGLDLTVPRGDVVGLLGPSGCGKSTLMRSIVGTQVIAGGRVRVLGDEAGSAALRRRVGYMTQDASVYDDLPVAANLRYFAKIVGADDGQVQRVIERTDLGSAVRSMAGDLSGGQRSRLSLAIALLGSPELLVLDEPTVGLDPVLRVELWRLFAELAADGVTLLVSSHVMDEATRCDSLVLMREGRIIAQDTPAGLLARTGTTTAEDAFLALIRAGEESVEDPAEKPGGKTAASALANGPGKHRATGETTDETTGEGR